MNQASSSYQRIFLDRLGQRFASRSQLVQEVSKVLHVGRDAVYRRLRGDTALTADELMLLAKTFEVRTEISPHSKGRVPTLRYPEGRRFVQNEFDHFIHLIKGLEAMKNLPGARADIASPELPMYYEMATPMLRNFKIFMFGITTWNLAKWKKCSFSPDLISKSLHDVVDQVIRGYYTVPARELWSIGILDVTLRQINYLAQVGRFENTEHLYQLFDELFLIVDHLEKMVHTGKRFPLGETPTDNSPDFRVYHNELSNTSNIVLVNSDVRSYLFTTLVNPNYIATSDPELCTEVQQWFDNLIEYGSALHSEAGKYAAQYFGYLRNQIRQQRERILVSQTVF
ncbi:hypothetical protein GGR28_001183 [Lewinella aquimaris]|uniref:Uncharacterized protein n=1 Tax=Neolewinella aquimaris TaxID=1835722 RepID=A0A840E090_9BACT|nr:hypothetical protein [Neolewinella aquimaris]MBB4078570.1 hypothetical protein [Neolewinella aquimaris]